MRDPRDTGGGLGDVFRARGLTSSGPPASDTQPPITTAIASPDLGGKLVLRRSRKGRGGKVAVVIEGVTGGDVALDALARQLKRALGCGASVEDSTVAVQGDQLDRVEAMLRSWGAARVVRGG